MIISDFAWNAETKSCVLKVEFHAETVKDIFDLATAIQSLGVSSDPMPIDSSSDDEWFGTGELAGLAGMPCSCQGVLRKAKKQKWLMRIKPNCSKFIEIHISNLPPATVEALRGNL